MVAQRPLVVVLEQPDLLRGQHVVQQEGQVGIHAEDAADVKTLLKLRHSFLPELVLATLATEAAYGAADGFPEGRLDR